MTNSIKHGNQAIPENSSTSINNDNTEVKAASSSKDLPSIEKSMKEGGDAEKVTSLQTTPQSVVDSEGGGAGKAAIAVAPAPPAIMDGPKVLKKLSTNGPPAKTTSTNGTIKLEAPTNAVKDVKKPSSSIVTKVEQNSIPKLKPAKTSVVPVSPPPPSKAGGRRSLSMLLLAVICISGTTALLLFAYKKFKTYLLKTYTPFLSLYKSQLRLRLSLLTNNLLDPLARIGDLYRNILEDPSGGTESSKIKASSSSSWEKVEGGNGKAIGKGKIDNQDEQGDWNLRRSLKEAKYNESRFLAKFLCLIQDVHQHTTSTSPTSSTTNEDHEDSATSNLASLSKSVSSLAKGVRDSIYYPSSSSSHFDLTPAYPSYSFPGLDSDIPGTGNRRNPQMVVHEIKSEIRGLKGMLLSRNNFAAAVPASFASYSTGASSSSRQ